MSHQNMEGRQVNVYLDNAQSGGPSISIVDDTGVLRQKIYLGNGACFSVADGFELMSPEDFPEHDRIIINTL